MKEGKKPESITMKYSKVFQEISFLTGKKTILELLESKIADEIFAATEQSRKELYQFAPWENKTVDDAKEFVARAVKQREEGMALDLSIHEKGTKRFVGIIGIHKFDPFTPLCEVGYWICSSVHGRGYATDALLTLLQFCRDELELVRVDACVAVENIASQRVLIKCGFKEEGFKEKAQLCHGVWHDMKLFGKILT